MTAEIAFDGTPGPNLAADLDAAGLSPTFSWRPGWLIFPTVEETDSATIAAIQAVLNAHVPTDPEPLPPTLEERVTSLEEWRATFGGE